MGYHLDDIAAFLQVIETGSISAAAERLGLSKSVVSKRITDLEAALGVELLHRSTRGVVPTDKGIAFHGRARGIMRELDEAAEEVADRENDLCGQLRITAPMSFGTMYFGPILFSFIARHPRLDLALNFDDRIIDLLGEGYDLAIRIARLPDSSLVARKLAVSRRIVCCSPGYAKQAGLPTTIQEIAQHACIGYANVHPSQLWQFEPDGEVRSLMVRSRIVANSGEAMRDAAIAGLGLAVLPLFIAAAALRRGELIDALPAARPTPDPIYAVHPQTRHLSRKVRALIDHLVGALGGELPWELL
jgi:DNA-binding transcriptional LysR family regulator